MEKKICTKKESAKDLKEKIWETEAIVTFHIWKDNTVWIEMEQRWDENLCADYFVERFRNWCIQSLFELWKSFIWEDDWWPSIELYHIIRDFLDQLKHIAKRDLWMFDDKSENEKDKEESIGKLWDIFKKYFNK